MSFKTKKIWNFVFTTNKFLCSAEKCRGTCNDISCVDGDATRTLKWSKKKWLARMHSISSHNYSRPTRSQSRLRMLQQNKTNTTMCNVTSWPLPKTGENETQTKAVKRVESFDRSVGKKIDCVKTCFGVRLAELFSIRRR